MDRRDDVLVQFAGIWSRRCNFVMAQVTLEQAERNLAEMVRQAEGGEEALIVREGSEVLARLTNAASESASQADGKPRVPGLLRGSVLSMAEDFDAPLDDFKDYL